MIVDVIFEETDVELEADFSEDEQEIDADFGEVQIVETGGEPYEGDYAVIPKVEEQKLLTKDKVMLDDVTVHAIPFFEVSNTSGGTTVYIAKEM